MRILSAVLFLLVLTVTAARAEPVPAAVRAQAAAFEAAMNGGEAEARAFHALTAPAFAAETPAGAFVGYFASQRRVTGGVEVVEVRMRDTRTAELLVRDRLYGALSGLTLGFDGTDQALLTAFEPGPAPAWAPPPAGRLSDRDVAARARDLIRRGCEADVFSGAVLIAHGDEILVEAACGMADRAQAVPNRVETRFNLASMDKMFTAVAVMRLEHDGLLSLDAWLGRYLGPDWVHPEPAERATVGHLLNHSGGLGSVMVAARQRPEGTLRNLADYQALLRTQALEPDFRVGTDFRYSNTGFLMLGAVIEAASGQAWDAYLAQVVFGPAGMGHTGPVALDAFAPDMARGYARSASSPDGWGDNGEQIAFRGTPAGGGYSTVRDLYLFARALRDGRLLPRSRVADMWNGGAHGYGAGFRRWTSPVGDIVGHDGFSAGVSTRLEIYLERDWVVVVLGNQDYASQGLLAAINGLIARTPGEEGR